uniref:Uncharacterized protein n=1 Tax=Mastacembelus armatus TaxID=205130 RepID=A0A3Q3NF65_9TELE
MELALLSKARNQFLNDNASPSLAKIFLFNPECANRAHCVLVKYLLLWLAMSLQALNSYLFLLFLPLQTHSFY